MLRVNESTFERGLSTATLAATLALGLAMSPGTAQSVISVRDMWAPDGEVRAIAQANNTLYLGGSFSRVGPVSGPAVALDLGTAVAQTPFPKVDGTVRAVKPDGSGGWYIGGSFTAVQGHRRINLAHIDAAGQVTSWNPGTDGAVYDIAVSGGVVYVVGSFLSVGTVVGFSGAGVVQRFGAAAIDAATGVATHWNPDPNGFPTKVEVGGGKVYLAGAFTTIYFNTSQEPRPCLAEFTEVVPGNPGTGALTGLFAGSDPSLSSISALELAGGNLFFAGHFPPSYRLRIYDITTSSFRPDTASFGGSVDDFAFDQANGIFFVGGNFSSVQGQSRTHLAALDLAAGMLLPWNVSADAPVRSLAMSANGLFVGGDFSVLGGTSRQGLGLVDPLSPAVLPWDAACGGRIYDVEVDGTRIYVGGEFSIINAVPRTNLAAIDEASGALLDWNPTTNATVEALMVSGNTVYVGGQFSTVNGTTRNRAAGIDALMGTLTAFNPNVDASFGTTVKAFAISGSKVYMGGAFGSVRGVARGNLAAVSATTGAPMLWNPFADGPVHALSYVPGTILINPILVVGGQFTFVGGQARNNLATLDTTGVSGGLDSPNGPVHSLAVIPSPIGGFDRIYVGGDFTSVAGQPRNHIAMLAAFGSVTSWDPNANGVVYSVSTVGNTAFVGGSFIAVGGQTRKGIAAIDVNGMATVWDPSAVGGSPPGIVYTLLEHTGALYAGGTFTSIAETPHCHFAGMGETVTAVESEAATAVAPFVVKVAPNPFEHSTSVHFSLASAVNAHVAVFDVAGRRVREIHSGWLAPGRHTMAWDGRDDAGQPVAAGVYFLGVITHAGSLGSKVYRLK